MPITYLFYFMYFILGGDFMEYSKYLLSICVVIASIATVISLAIINPVYFVISLLILFMYTELVD